PKPQPSPSLMLTARVMPWASQPLVSADANAQALNLAALWPAAPVTALSGRVLAQPDGAAWRASVTLANALPGPADQARLPLQSLSAEVEQRGVRWTVSDLRAELGGGTLKAQGGFDLDTAGGASLPTAWQGEATASGVRPALVWSTLPPAALDAQSSARAAPTARAPQAVDLSARVTPSARQPAGVSLAELIQSELRVKGQWLPTPAVAGTPAPPAWHGLLQLAEAHIAIAGAQLDAKGQLDTAQLRHDGQGSLALPGLNLAWKGLASHARGEGETTLQLASAERTLAWVRSLQTLPWMGEPVRKALAALGMQSADGEVNASLKWAGGLGALGWPAAPGGTAPDAVAPLRLEAALNVPRLALESDTTGPLALADIALKAQGPLQALQISAQGSATLPPWRASLDAAGQLRASASLREGGELNLSRLALRLNPVANPADAKASAAGWALESPQPLRIVWKGAPGQSVSLDAGTGTLLLRPLNAGSTAPETPLTLAWQRLRWQGASLETQGRLQGLSLPWIDTLATLTQPDGRGPLQAAGLSGDLLFDADWDVRLPADASTPPALTASLQRRGGSLRWRQMAGGAASGADAAPPNGNGALDAGVRDARVSLALQDRRWRAQLRWDTERLGQASAELNATVAPGSAASEASLLERWWPADTPIQGNAQVRLPQVGVWSVLAPPGWRVQGTLNADATVAGTRGAPTWSGTLQADELALRSVVDGIAFTNGQLRATLAGDRIRVDRFSLQGPGGVESGGTLEASGEATWRPAANGLAREPLINLQAKAERLRVSNRPDRRLTLSGEINAQLEGALLRLRGQLKADSALFILPDEMAPTLGRDVVVRSTRTLPTEAGSAQRVQTDLSVQLDLGPRFEVRGQGLQTRLEGQLTVQATRALPTPRVLGEVRTASGTYRAYDQQLNIESGALRFTGPYDDPALDIRAVRKLPANVEQRVGVQISGNAQAPRVSLFADPDMPEADKLAWLVLGRPASTAGAQAFVLQQAARRLLSQGDEPLDGTLARTLGLDEIGFEAPSTGADGTTTQAALTVGKRLSSDLYLSYEQSLAGAMSTVSILYDLSRRLTLRARAGTENAIDLIFTHRFD
ncbi:translocation/assembly module TamB domain-containing protein, partial [Hydrogenophaga sp. A37]|uniref:translocation/assembly module TamB domain-containing protein n=1 Tax=Hydrogenophaga sp. A37 TaxID=1945864 RepID=UPI001C0C3CC5